jgi:hypothetical protein
MTMVRKHLLIGAVATAGCTLPSAVAAQNLVPSATVTVGGGYSSNPFLGRGDSEGSANAQVTVTPRLDIIDDTDSGVISGFYNRTEYFNGYDANDGYGVNVSANHAINTRTSVGVFAGYDSQILGAGGAFSNAPVILPGTIGTGTGGAGGVGTDTGSGGTTGAVPVVPVPTNPVIIDPGVIGGDIGLIGLRQRRNSLNAGISGSFRPSEVSSWNFGANVSRNSYPDSSGLAISSRTYGVNTGYTRSLSERSSVGLQVSGTIVDYARVPSSRFVNPQLTYSRLLAERWSLNLAVGVSYVDDGFSSNFTPSANGSLCRSSERGSFCLLVARQPSVSAFGGARNQTSVSANYSYRLAERTSLSANASYQHVSNGVSSSLVDRAGRAPAYLNASATVNQQLARRLSAFATALYRDVNGLGVPASADVGGRIGLALTVGGRQ